MHFHILLLSHVVLRLAVLGLERGLAIRPSTGVVRGSARSVVVERSNSAIREMAGNRSSKSNCGRL